MCCLAAGGGGRDPGNGKRETGNGVGRMAPAVGQPPLPLPLPAGLGLGAGPQPRGAAELAGILVDRGAPPTYPRGPGDGNMVVTMAS